MNKIRVEIIVKGEREKVWKIWNDPESIKGWAFASDDWEAPYAENDLKVGGKFVTRMSAKDKSASFDFEGIYTTVVPNEKIEYVIEDGRKVSVLFEDMGDGTTKVAEDFDPENINSEDMQRAGWQAILDNFKKYVESR